MRLAAGALHRTRSGVRAMMERSWARPDVIHLELGEPGQPTPRHILEAAAQAAARGATRYSPTAGLPALREAAAEKLRAFNGHRGAEPRNVLVTNGGAHALFAIFGSLLDPGSRVLIPDPGWASFTMIARAVGAEPVYYPLTEESHYLPDPEQIRRLADTNTRVLVVNSPSNPLGTVLPQPILEELHALSEELDLWIVADECYDAIDFTGKYTSFGTLEDTPQRVLSVFSFSKVYAMTGFRVGYCHLPSAVVDPVLALLEPTILCVNTPAQHAALAALQGDQEFVRSSLDCYRQNRELALRRLEGSMFEALEPDGGFYVWVKAEGAGVSSEQLAVELLETYGVAVVPGIAFGTQGERCLRLSLATTPDMLEEGLNRLLKYRHG